MLDDVVDKKHCWEGGGRSWSWEPGVLKAQGSGMAPLNEHFKKKHGNPEKRKYRFNDFQLMGF